MASSNSKTDETKATHSENVVKEKKEEDDDELTFDLSDNDEEDPNREKGAAGDDGEEEIEQTETTREREEKLMEMIYECGTAKEVAAYIDSLESTLLAARGREYQLRIEEKRGTTSKTETNPSAMTKIIDQLRNNISVDCLERGQSIEEEDETVMLTIRINAGEDKDRARLEGLDAIIWWHYDSIVTEDEEGSTIDVRFSIAWGRDGEGLDEIKTLCRFDTTVEEESSAVVDKEQLKALLSFLLSKHSDEEKKLVAGNGLQTNFWELLITYVSPSLHNSNHQKAIAKQLRKALISTKKVDFTKTKKVTPTPVKPSAASVKQPAHQSSQSSAQKGGGGVKRKAEQQPSAPSGKKGKKKKKSQKHRK